MLDDLLELTSRSSLSTQSESDPVAYQMLINRIDQIEQTDATEMETAE